MLLPRVSIVTPAYNSAHHLDALITSIVSQSYSNWQWIIVNDGSTDGTKAILDRISDPRVTVTHQENAGTSSARNRGLDAAQGEYVTFLDADDVLPPDALRIRLDYLERNPEIDIVNGGVRVTQDGTDLRPYLPSTEKGLLLDRLARLDASVFLGVIYMLRRDKIGDYRFLTGVSHCEDLIFFLTLAHDKGLTYGAVEDVVYEYRVTPGSAMSNLVGIESGYLELLRRAAKMDRLSEDTRKTMRRRITSIMMRSWLRKGKPLRAAAIPRRVRAAARGRL